MERDLCNLRSLLPEGSLTYNENAPVWGWNRSLVHDLRMAGYLELPTDRQLADIRRLSSRATAVEMLAAIRLRLPKDSTVGESRIATDIDGLVASLSKSLFASRADGAAFAKNSRDTCGIGVSPSFDFPLLLKAPFSGSGRGLRLINDMSALQHSNIKNWAERCIREQGGVVVEPYYDKVCDFALEYRVTPDQVKYLGLSLFQTNGHNVYAGNLIAPQPKLWHNLNQMMPDFDFEQLINIVKEEIATRFVGRYFGPVGVDMMVVKDTKSLRVHPCVEVNVRRTMGELSLHILPLLAEGTEGFFDIIFDKNSASLHHTVAAMPPAMYDDSGRLVSGTKILTPLAADTHYVAVVETR